MSNLNWRFGKALRWLRLERGLNGSAYAKAMGLPLDVLEEIEAGRAFVGVNEVEQIAAGFQVDAYQLLQVAAPHAARPDSDVILVDLVDLEADTIRWPD
jgi:transcriptional regulator with XRE-family HTH domain